VARLALSATRAALRAATTDLSRATDSDGTAARRRARAREEPVAADVALVSDLDVASLVAPVRDFVLVVAVTTPVPVAVVVTRACAVDVAVPVPVRRTDTARATPEQTT
jgi:hypothetical protein